ncbi:ABC-F family ATP-binding cassette domain-containing protein [Williamwhitmania taraxaci]|uniref:ATP-binding cassette, subfamily F, uup n=1 Tax=Williamwhitmania taraxaci TaxID=1640674 RepID=A0A1G6H2Z5_9BACT|nr:ABC-F family ATP-binding cassette domain-containing protein [Williamwhitmania taraxaci]SDB88571.1 ATP-binding cassette, subfamily F, uup [Williamwhitmania taraxaci]
MASFLQVENLTKSFGDLTLFEGLKFSVEENQRVALVARNGAGKSTLLNIISGKDSAEAGAIVFRNGITVGYLDQDPEYNSDLTVYQAAFASSSEMVEVVRNYELAVRGKGDYDLGELIEKMDHMKAWDYEVRVKQILTRFKVDFLDKKMGELSGGQRKRVALANVLINEPDFLILDEPTNHLDLEMVEWLEGYLSSSSITLLMVTHDRYFLDRVCTDIIEIDAKTCFQYKGNYTYFLEKRQQRTEAHAASVEKAVNLLRREQDWMNRQPQARGTKAKYRIDAFYDLKDKANSGRREDSVDISSASSRLGGKIISMEGVSKKFGSQIILNDLDYIFSRGEKVGIVGDNGAGKTTFLQIATGEMQADSGKIEVGETVVFGYYRQDGLQFDETKKVIDIARDIAEVVKVGKDKTLTVSQFLTLFLFPPDSQQSFVSKLSGGEKRRLYLLTILMKSPNFLVLDEPTNDLDILTLNVLEDYLRDFAGCLLVVSHDRYFMDKVVDHIFIFEGNGVIKDFVGSYSELRDFKMEQEKQEKKERRDTKTTVDVKKPKVDRPRKLTFKEKMELEALEKELDDLSMEKATLETELSSGTLSSTLLVDKSTRVGDILSIVEEKEMRWLELNEIDGD